MSSSGRYSPPPPPPHNAASASGRRIPRRGPKRRPMKKQHTIANGEEAGVLCRAFGHKTKTAERSRGFGSFRAIAQRSFLTRHIESKKPERALIECVSHDTDGRAPHSFGIFVAFITSYLPSSCYYSLPRPTSAHAIVLGLTVRGADHPWPLSNIIQWMLGLSFRRLGSIRARPLGIWYPRIYLHEDVTLEYATDASKTATRRIFPARLF